jgi:hypothetical protein
LSGVIGLRSEPLTTNIAGPTAEPWKTLAFMLADLDIFPSKLVVGV